jgi:hypothetical protein
MTAKGKINASNVTTGDRIIVQISAGTGTVRPSDTKTGEGVFVARVIGKGFRSAGAYEARGKYIVHTSAGSFEAAPIQTMWLAPEDAAGIKRARAEAELEDAERAAPAPEEFTEEERAELAGDFQTSGALDEAHEEAELEDAERAADQDDADEMHSECEAKGCDLSEGALKCRRYGAEPLVIEDLTLHSQDGKVDNVNNASDTEATDRLSMAITKSGAEKISALTQPTIENHTGSAVVSLLEKVWARIRADHPELPEVVIITGSGLVGASKWGHFRAEGWKVQASPVFPTMHKHELFLAGEALAKGARQVLQTMLHEAAHTLAKVRGQQDTSRQGRWHNATFREVAEELGLEHKGSKADPSNGFSFVTLTAETVKRYTDLLAELDREIRLVCHLPLWMGGEADQDEGGEKITGKPQGEGGTKSGPTKATCLCEEPLIIRLSQKVMDMAVVRCDDCKALFLDRS